MQDTGCFGLVPWADPEGWYGNAVQDWERMSARGGFMFMYGKNQYNIVK